MSKIIENNINEDSVEYTLINFLKKQGYEYFLGYDIAPNGESPQRDNFNSVILEKQFKKMLKKLNPNLPESARVEAFNKVMNIGLNDIMANNEKFHEYLTNGLTVEYFKDGSSIGMQVKLIDFDDIKNNEFWVVNQFVIEENKWNKRLDLVIFVNGLPLVVAELKNPIDEKATLDKAYTQIQNYKNAVPSIFYYNSLCIISDGIDAKMGSLSASFSRYSTWKSPNKDDDNIIPAMQIMANNMLKKEVLLDLIRYNTVFETEEVLNKKSGQLSLVKIKKIAAYHQYYLVKKAIKETIRAIQETGNRRIGVVWHTQGSGKSLSMVFYSAKLVIEPKMENPTIVLLTDRNDLDDQLFATFSNSSNLLRQSPVQAKNRENLKELLKVVGGGIIFTTIQKFYPENMKNEFETLSKRKNIIVIADEAHRSQYGFTGKIDKDGNLKYGNAKYLRDALPNASFIGFTGTPIEKEDRDTKQVFGDYIDIYDIAQAVKDGATVPISYESRLIKIKFDEKTNEKIDYLVENIEGATKEQTERAKKKNAQINAVVGHPERLKDVASDIVTHFEKRETVFEGKGMIVCMTRQIAVDLYQQIVNLRPDWHKIVQEEGKIKVIMTSSSDDPEDFQPHYTNKKDRKFLATRFKNSKDELKLVIVQAMWLTGFDAPPLHTLYIDRKMKGAGLMQAIARVNRVYKDKPGGLIVDYIGIGQDLRSAMGVYTKSGGKGDAVVNTDELIFKMNSKFEVVSQMFYGFNYLNYFNVEVSEKLKILLGAQNFILKDEKLKDRFLDEITALSKLYVLATPSNEAEIIKDRVAFFQAIKSRINKFTPSGGKTDYQVSTAIKQIVDDVLSSDGVVDIFEAAGLKSPSLSILSEEFLLEVKNMKHKNLAFELLKKLLNDDVKARKRKNTVQAKKFSEMLSSVIKRYHNNQIDTAQIIEELSRIAREMKLEDNKAKDLGLTDEEYAFYSILSQNTSTRYLEDHKMKELIHLIVEIIRKNATVDWNKRSDVRAKLRLLVKKVLMKYGYPPDVAKLEADKVIEQGELLASELN